MLVGSRREPNKKQEPRFLVALLVLNYLPSFLIVSPSFASLNSDPLPIHSQGSPCSPLSTLSNTPSGPCGPHVSANRRKGSRASCSDKHPYRGSSCKREEGSRVQGIWP